MTKRNLWKKSIKKRNIPKFHLSTIHCQEFSRKGIDLSWKMTSFSGIYLILLLKQKKGGWGWGGGGAEKEKIRPIAF